MRRTATLAGAAAVAAVIAATPAPPPGEGPAAAAEAAPVGPDAATGPTAPSAATRPAAAVGAVTTGADADEDGPDATAAPVLRSAEGFLVAPGTAAAGNGPVLRYSVEVEVATGLDPREVAVVAEAALGDVRSWARDRRLERVDDPTRADARLVVAVPDTVDALCAEAGLDTAGVYSCWNGRIAALNARRWATGAYGFPDVATYRLYLVNHEVGHVLGLGHVACPGPGAVAPLMMQQSKGLDGCVANGWAHP